MDEPIIPPHFFEADNRQDEVSILKSPKYNH